MFGVTLSFHKGPWEVCKRGTHKIWWDSELTCGKRGRYLQICVQDSHIRWGVKKMEGSWESHVIQAWSCDVERGRLAWGVTKIGMVSPRQNFGKFTFFKVYGVCTPGGLSNPSKSGTMRKFRQSYGTHFSSIFEIRPRSRDTAVWKFLVWETCFRTWMFWLV